MSGFQAVRDLSFRKIPHQPGVFLGYVDQSPEVLSFYRHPATLSALIEAANEICREQFPRQEMAEILQRQNEVFGSSSAVARAIEDLAKPDSVAVLTGQQVGLFTGPILTVYKALTALRLCAELRRKGFNSVPIFWMASDDHDLAEITRLIVPAQSLEARVLDSRELLFGTTELPPRPVGDIRLPENIRRVIAAYGASIPGNWNHEVEAQLASACQPGSTFAEAFGRLMAQLFRDRGLILFDPRNSGAKKLAVPVMQKALLEAQGLRTQLLQRSQALRAASLEPQVAVLPRSTLVFLEDEGERRLLVTGEGDFLLKDTSKHLAIEKLLDLAENEPQRFSPNVLLRPVVQDHLFPTAAYVGGPAEVSYFAQVEPLYRVYNRPMPVIWPRAGFTVLDADTCSTLERYGLHLEDCLRGESHVIRRILQAQPARFEIVIDELRQAADRGIEELKPSLMAADASLGPAADTVRRKLLHRIASLQTKFVNFEMRHNRVLHDEVLQLLNSCCPNGNLQERELGAYYLLSRHGPALLDTLYELVDIEAFAHRTVCIQNISARR